MKITFFSNFMNHHQLPFCMQMVKHLGDNFKFVATQKIPEERMQLGYEDMNEKYDFIIRSYEDESEAYKLANESDVVIIGDAPRKYVYNRLILKKGITYLYSERIMKEGGYKRLIKWIYYKFYKERIQNNHYYLLCASAYSAYDYNSLKLFNNRAYKWGYFPAVKKYSNIKKIINSKEKNSILWVARFINWKHPEMVIEIASKLKEAGYNFKIKMIGNGKLYKYIFNMIEKRDLTNEVELTGSMSPEKVRHYMEKSEIFLFTSDKGEGWGAVLNEAMNSGCSVVASHEIGSVPFLINDNQNGLIFENGNINDLYNKIKLLMDNKAFAKKIGINAYKTLLNVWNPDLAAKRIIKLSKNLLKGKQKQNSLFDYGPCSIAQNIKDNWYKGV